MRCAENQELPMGDAEKGALLNDKTTHLNQPVQSFTEEWPAHGALGKGQGGGPIPAQSPAEGPELLGQAKQQTGTQERSADSTQRGQTAQPPGKHGETAGVRGWARPLGRQGPQELCRDHLPSPEKA